ncbi:hypothetical protein GGI43DRAFT_206666 [Trichoderma evansii]
MHVYYSIIIKLNTCTPFRPAFLVCFFFPFFFTFLACKRRGAEKRAELELRAELHQTRIKGYYLDTTKYVPSYIRIIVIYFIPFHFQHLFPDPLAAFLVCLAVYFIYLTFYFLRLTYMHIKTHIPGFQNGKRDKNSK